ncbi:MAG: hypothetical protein OEM52_05635 [bacterium]|nr:hypothetical protein [bacterium]
MNSRYAFVLLVLVFACVGWAQIGPAITHTPVATAVAGQPVTINFETSLSTTDVTRAVVAYRISGSGSYTENDLMASGNRYMGEIPGSAVTEKGLEYFVFITTASGTRHTSPPSSDPVPASPFSVAVRASGSAQAGTVTFQIVSPDPNEPANADEEIVVAIAVLGGTLDIATVKLELDGAAVTRWANITPELISFLAKDLGSGKHEIRVSGNTPTGYAIPAVAVSFKAVKALDVSRARSPIVFNGNAWSETRYEEIQQPSTTTPGDVTGEVKWWQREQVQFNGRYGALDFGGRFYVTNEEQKIEQPRNRYQVWFGMKWWKLGLGDNNPDYTPLTLSGKRVRGLQFELHGGPAHLEVVHGYTDKAIEVYGTSTRHSFARELTGFRNWYGNRDGSKGGLTIVKVRDDRYSINKDSAKTRGVNPIENLVIGGDLQLAFDQSRILFTVEGATSLYNRDIGPGAISKDSLENLPGAPSMPFDPLDYEKWFVLNQNLVPLNPSEKTSIAYTAGLQLNYFQNLFRLKFRSTGSAFYALGSPYTVQDDAGLSFSDRIRLLNNRLYLTIGYETARNNLDNNSATGTVKSGMINFDVSYYPTQEYLPDVSLSFRNSNRKNDVDTVSTFINTTVTPNDTTVNDNRVKESFNAMTFYVAKSFRFANYDHSASLTLNNFKRDDKYSRSGGSPYNAVSNVMNLSWKTKWVPDLSTTLNYSNMKNENAVSVSSGTSTAYTNESTTFSTIGIRGDKSWKKEQITAFAGVASQSASGLQKYSKLGFSLGGSYKFPYQFTARIQGDFNSTKYDNTGGSSTTIKENFAWLRLEKTF